MALLILTATATETGIVTPEFGFAAPVRLGCSVLMIVVAIRAVHMRFGWLGFGSGHGFTLSRFWKNTLYKEILESNRNFSKTRFDLIFPGKRASAGRAVQKWCLTPHNRGKMPLL